LEEPVTLVTRTITLLVVLLTLAGVAFAQEAAAAGVDVAGWFASTAALAAVIVAIVAFIKTHILKGLHDLATVAVSLAVGLALGLAGAHLGHVDGGLVAGATFGLAAGLLASGGYDGVRALIQKPSAETVSTLPPSRKA
jgi:hypothetical protein